MKFPGLKVNHAILMNYSKIASRKMRQQKGYTIINISGLAVGLACCAIMMLWVSNERSFDRFHTNRDSIYRLIKETGTNGKDMLDARIPYPLAETIMGKIPEVKYYTRYQGVDSWKISYENKSFYTDYITYIEQSFKDRVIHCFILFGTDIVALEIKLHPAGSVLYRPSCRVGLQRSR